VSTSLRSSVATAEPGSHMTQAKTQIATLRMTIVFIKWREYHGIQPLATDRFICLECSNYEIAKLIPFARNGQRMAKPGSGAALILSFGRFRDGVIDCYFCAAVSFRYEAERVFLLLATGNRVG